MSTATGTMQGCAEAMLQSMTDVYANHSARVDSVGLTQSFLSDLNTRGRQIIALDQGFGNKRTARISYLQRSAQTASDTPSCTATDNPLMTEEEVVIDQYKQVSFFLNDEQLRCLATPEVLNTNIGTATGAALQMKQYLYDALVSQMNAIYRGIETDNAALVAASFGTHVSTGNANAVTVNILSSSSQALRIDGFTDVKLGFNQNGYDGRFILVGQLGQLFNRANIMRGVGSANDAGVDFAKLQSVLEYDPYLSTISFSSAFGSANSLVAYEPGAIQLVPFLENRGAFQRISETFAHFTLPDPRTGLTFDVDMSYDDCDKKTTVIIKLNWALWTAPTDLFKATDPRLSGVNNILEFTAAAA